MANFKEVNAYIKTNFPDLDIVAVRGEGYVYFIGTDADELESIFTNPTTTSTSDLVEMVMEEIQWHHLGK